jgi:arsenate reductase-like glutaredoxin family protein
VAVNGTRPDGYASEMRGASSDAARAQVFGLTDDQGTRAAIRFFKERRVEIHLVDLRRKPIAAGELRRFVERFGPAALLDTGSRAYREAGLGHLRMDGGEIVERLLADAGLLRLPLVRYGDELSVGRDETAWRRWFTPARSGGGADPRR